jgi:hypothetical protein
MLVQKTLRTLARANYDQVLWVVIPGEELVAYQQAVAGNAIHCMLVPTEKGLVKQRQHFRSTMLPGTEIVFIDDDIEAIKLKMPDGLKHCTNIITLANFVFDSMTARGEDCLLAGIYPVANREWMSNTVTENNAYIVGALYFCRNDDRLREPEVDECEDHYRAMSEQLAFRPVLRFNFIGIQTQYFKNKGGMQDDRTPSNREAVVGRYASEFFQIAKAVMRKGKPDLKYLKKPVAAKFLQPVTSDPVLSADPPTASESPSSVCEQHGPSD